MATGDQARELLQLISEGFVFADRDFRVREVNAEAERMERRPASELIGKSLWEVRPGTEKLEVGRLWRSAMRDGKPVSLEYRYAWPDGRSAWLEMRAFPTGDGLAIFYRDVSDRKRSEEELKRAEAELMHASRLSAMGTMASTLAHELAQPLTAAANYVEATSKMLRKLPAAEARDARKALGFAGSAVGRATDILKRLRGFVSKRPVAAQTEDLPAIIADAGVLMLPQAQSEGVEIDFRLDRHAKWVKADAVQVQQVLINLVRNAIEAMAGVEPRRIVISTAAVSPAAVEVAVADTGPGLDGQAGDPFAPFQSSKPDGMGVGLSISRTIVESHGGTIDVERPSDGGARFRFTLPRGVPPR